MTREEQIKKAAHDFSWGWCDDKAHPLNDGFIEGAKWADFHPHWIPVEERLPEENERIIAYNGAFNEIHLCDFHDGIFEDFYGPFDGTITHWMPIVPPRKEENNE